MSWQCPGFGTTNDDSILRCVCGYELDTPLNDKQKAQLQNGESSIKDIDFYEVANDKSSPHMVLSSTVQRLEETLSFMFTRPAYIFS